MKTKISYLYLLNVSERILLDHKETNVNHRNDQGGTALHFASAGKY
jgi:ankyrin repeat protein